MARHIPPSPADPNADLRYKLAELERRMRVLEGSFNPMWIPITLKEGWVNAEGGSPAWTGAAYMKDPFGFVWFRGLIKNGPSGINVLAFEVKEHYRPLGNGIWTVMSADEEGDACVRVLSNGEGQIKAAGSTAFLGLWGISYLAEA